ncbi:THAP domain-containing protein 1 A-like, partial [Temnothorax curvispinosus]|uniref:THAP domain-containing protein 1 A-like n=1 Tax=Temnothorax curvispinosus TaxID=300111 RepID=A0A6J1Q2W2_9HYME
MPTCCIKHCTSRTSDKTKNLKFFGFPKEDVIRQQWLDACKRKETDIKVDTAMICSNHFDADCFIMEWTQPRLKNVPAKEMKRLRKNSIPTKMLIPEEEEEKKKRGKKRKRMPENGESK